MNGQSARAGIVGIVLAGVVGVLCPAPWVHAGPGGVAASAVEFPQTPAGQCATRFIECWSASSREAWEAFETEFASSKRLSNSSPAAKASRMLELSAQWGRLKVSDVSVASDGGVIVRGTLDPAGSAEFTFDMSESEPGKLDGVMMASGPGVGRSVALTPELREQTVQGVASAVESGYVFPKTGQKMGQALRSSLDEGAYDSIGEGSELAHRLTEELRAIGHDLHLGVLVAPPPSGAAEECFIPGTGGPGNYGFRKVEILEGNVGYVRLDGFVPGEEAERTAAAAMAFVAHADALIFDLRWNGGGSPEMIQFLTSYLFDGRTHLNDMVDREGAVVEEYWTLDDVPGERLGPQVPVYVLTSGYTFSGAEEFTYNLKSLKRATIVGETTGGGAHPVRMERVNDHFIVGVPYMRARNAVTGTNWEGTGVEPDVAVPADEALDRALEAAHAAG